MAGRETPQMVQGMKTSVHWVGALGDVVLLNILGYVDTTTCKELAKQIRNLMDENHLQIIADLGGVTYISSAGWGVFVGEIKNIRDRGGDLKIVQMTSEVIEVFEMLEFNRILNHYETMEEAIDEFDLIRGVDITQSAPLKKNMSLDNPVGTYSAPAAGSQRWNKGVARISVSVGPAEMPLVEKIKQIVIDNPLGGVGYIQKQLKTEKYGFSKLGLFKGRRILKELNLDTKEKRFRFYRSR